MQLGGNEHFSGQRPYVQPAFTERNIPIALSTDENYLPYVKVVVNSIISCTKSGNIDILILHNGIPPQEIDLFLVDFAGVQNVSVRFVNIKKFVESTELSKFDQKRYLSAAACYRLLLPDVLDAYDKLIYLDVDTVVCHDLGELYATDLADNMFGAVIDVVNSSSKSDYAEWARGYGFVEWDEYVNTGVMLFNLARFRCASILDKLMPIAIEASKWFCDQDALNFVCKGQILHLDPRWNVQVGDYGLKKQKAIASGEAFVYHFTGGEKPWSHPMHRYASLWWLNVRENGAALWRKSIGLSKSGGLRKNVGVSIIVPVYNAEPYLWECLISVLSQAEQSSMEVICVDDGSTDRSLEMLQTLLRLDTRVKLIRQTHQGPGVARNAGLDAAKGEYIFFLDADDRLSSGRELRQAYEQASEDCLDILLAQGSIILESGEPVRREAYLNRKLVPEERVFAPDALGANLYMVTPMGPGGKLFRRKFIEDKNLRFPALRRSEDFPMIQLALSLAERIGVMQMPVVDKRIGVASSLESTKDETPLIFFEAEQLLRDSLKKRKLWRRFQSAVFSAFVVRLAYNLRAVGSYSSFKAIAAKYRHERKQWICWKDVTRPEQYSESRQLVKNIEKEREEDDQIALFVKLREANAANQAKAAMRLQCQEAGMARDEALLKCDAMKKSLDEVRSVRDAALKERDALRKNLEATRSVRDAALKERDALRKNLDATRAVRDAALKERDALKKTLDATRAVRDDALAKRSAMKKSLDEVRGVRDAALNERDALRKNLEATRAVRDAVLKERDALRKNLEATRAVRDAALKERDALKKTLAATRAVRDDALAKRNSLKKTLDAVRKVRDAALSERDSLKKVCESINQICLSS